jgi:hypothetical protein
MMVHGFVFGQYDTQSGPRGDDQLGSLNWGMLMLGHTLAGGRFQLRTMLSLDAATVTERGYPQLLQSGETFEGEPIHDRQHPHDFFMELGAVYERAITGAVGVSLYAAASGEPALSPVAFMHRPSAMDSPIAALGHHWQDVTHISFGVLTAGLFGHSWKLEASAFNGRSPDENRWDIDRVRIDSYSGRLTLNPTANWSASAGYGYLRSPEAAEPEESAHRITAAVMHGARVGADGQWATTVIWGATKHAADSRLSNSYLLESEAVLDLRNTVFGRAEYVEKTAEDLVIDPGPASSRRLGISAFTVGYVRELVSARGMTVGLGAQGTLNFVGSRLEGVYGSKTPAGAVVFLRLRPRFPGAMAPGHRHPM